MRFKMLVTKPGSPDGIKVIKYEAGKSYPLPKDLGDAFVHLGWAELEGPVSTDPDGAHDGQGNGDGPDYTTHGVPAAAAMEHIAGIETVEALDKLDAGEREHPKHKGGRVSVLQAIAERRAVIEAEAAADADPGEPDAPAGESAE